VSLEQRRLRQCGARANDVWLYLAVFIRVKGGEVPGGASLAPKIGPLGMVRASSTCSGYLSSLQQVQIQSREFRNTGDRQQGRQGGGRTGCQGDVISEPRQRQWSSRDAGRVAAAQGREDGVQRLAKTIVSPQQELKYIYGSCRDSMHSKRYPYYLCVLGIGVYGGAQLHRVWAAPWVEDRCWNIRDVTFLHVSTLQRDGYCYLVRIGEKGPTASLSIC